MKQKSLFNRLLILVTIGTLLFYSFVDSAFSQNEILAHWRFEQIQHLNVNSTSVPVIGQPLTASERGPEEPQPFVFDNSGKGNYLQVRGSHPSPLVFSDNVPTSQVEGKPNTRSLVLKRGEYVVTYDRPLAYYDLRKSWTIEASLMCNLLGTEQVYLCKEGAGGQLAGDVSVGFDNMYKKYFVEVMCADGKARRIVAGDEVEAGKWYDVRA